MSHLKLVEEPESHFCSSLPNQLRGWDNSAISLLKECPRKFFYSIICGFQPKHTPAPLAFGSFLHAGMEFYDKARFAGKEHQEALRLSIHFLLCQTTTHIRGKWEERYTPEGVQQIFIEGEGEEVSYRHWVGDEKRTRFTLIRTLVWYTKTFAAAGDPLKTISLPSGKPALEVSFRFELPLASPDGDHYIYSGNIDKIGEMEGKIYLQERKHTVTTLSSYYFDRFSPDGQTTGYQAAAQIILGQPIAGLVVDAAQVAVTFSRFHRHIQTRPQEILDEWLSNTIDWIKQAEHYARSRFYPMNETACHKFRGCQYRGVCSKSPSVRRNFLESDFIKRFWNPLMIRERKMHFKRISIEESLQIRGESDE